MTTTMMRINAQQPYRHGETHVHSGYATETRMYRGPEEELRHVATDSFPVLHPAHPDKAETKWSDSTSEGAEQNALKSGCCTLM